VTEYGGGTNKSRDLAVALFESAGCVASAALNGSDDGPGMNNCNSAVGESFSRSS
jgi:hypothetical protein